MKTMILTLMMSLVMIAPAAFSKADSTNVPENNTLEKFQAAVNLNHNDIVQVRLYNPEKEKVMLKVYSEKNVKLLQRNLKKTKSLNLNCDMSLLEAGNYRFVIEKEGEEVLSKELELK
jgi:methionine-rich copper-binding protein CopC